MSSKFDNFFKNSTLKQEKYEKDLEPKGNERKFITKKTGSNVKKPIKSAVKSRARVRKRKKDSQVTAVYAVPKAVKQEQKKAYSFTLSPSNAEKLKKLATERGYRSSSALLDEILSNIK